MKENEFWFGLLIGILGGVLGNLYVGAIFRWIDNLNSLPDMAGVIILTILFFGGVVYPIERKLMQRT